MNKIKEYYSKIKMNEDLENKILIKLFIKKVRIILNLYLLVFSF